MIFSINLLMSPPVQIFLLHLHSLQSKKSFVITLTSIASIKKSYLYKHGAMTPIC